MSKPRRMELHRRQRRKRSLNQLRSQYQSATSDGIKQAILAKVAKISPTLSQKLFLAAGK